MIKVIGNRGILEVIAIFSLIMLAGSLIAGYAIKTSTVYILLNSLQSPQFVEVSYMLDAVLVLIIAMLLLKRNSAASIISENMAITSSMPLLPITFITSSSTPARRHPN